MEGVNIPVTASETYAASQTGGFGGHMNFHLPAMLVDSERTRPHLAVHSLANRESYIPVESCTHLYIESTVADGHGQRGDI